MRPWNSRRISCCWTRRARAWAKQWCGGWRNCGRRRVTIVACDPATLARDLAALTAAGFQLEKLTLVDLFPQTFHLETVAELK